MADIFTRFTLRSLAKNRVRTAVTVAGIALSTALLAAVLTSVASVQNGLSERTATTEGTWHVFATNVSDNVANNLAADGRTVDVAVMRELGMSKLSDVEADTFGQYATVRTLPTVEKGSWETDGVPLSLMPEMKEGRMPEAPGEVALPAFCRGQELGGGGARSDGPLAVGGTIELDLGTRLLQADGAMTSSTSFDTAYHSENGETVEEFVDVQTRTFTVVGFYATQPGFIGNNYTGASSSIVALTASDGSQEGAANVFATTRGMHSLNDLRKLVDDAGGAGGAESTYFHGNLLRYLGVDDGRAIWGSLWMVAAVLAVVIVVASVSLIYNAFAISVAERTRQFGLLSSLGASKRQLRRTVIAEALVLGVAGVPLGLLAGFAGTAGVFAVSQEAFASMIGNDTGVAVVVEPLVLAVAALLSLATLVASAWAPSARAARVSAVDAIRQTQDVRLSKRAERAAASGAGDSSVKLGLAGRLFGIPGFVAHRNLSRSTARGRTVVASLAVSTTLIVVTGSLAGSLALVSDRTGSINGAGSGADITVSVHADQTGDSYIDLSDRAQELDRFTEKAKEIEGAEFLGSSRQGQAEAVVPGSMITPEARDAREQIDAERNSSYNSPSFGTDGNYYGSVALFYLDDGTWRNLVNELGLDKAAYTDAANPRAIGLNLFRETLGSGTYVSAKPFAGTGTIELFTIQDREGYSSLGLREGEDGAPAVGFISRGTSADTDVDVLPASEITTSTAMEVGAFANDEPAALNVAGASGQFPVLVLPESVAAAVAGESDHLESPFTYSFASFSFKAEDHAKVTEELEALAADSDGLAVGVYDLAEDTRQNRLQMQAIELFVLCFSVITTLIAIANVFNTLANGIILRTREFAVLRSVGMGGRAFARMLVYECASYALRGLVIGLAVATIVAYLLHRAMSLSFAGVAFTLPWPYVGLAVTVVLAVLALSVVYALRRARAGSIVEALRADAI